MVVTVRVTPGRPIEVLDWVPFSFSGSQTVTGGNSFTDQYCPRNAVRTLSGTSTTTVNGGYVAGLESNTPLVSGHFAFNAAARLRGDAVLVLTQSDSGPPPDCNAPVTTTDRLSSSLHKQVNVIGTGTLRGGSFTGSARGVVDFGRSVNTAREMGTNAGNAEMMVTWNLVRQ
jgi:hypothetical protein